MAPKWSRIWLKADRFYFILIWITKFARFDQQTFQKRRQCYRRDLIFKKMCKKDEYSAKSFAKRIEREERLSGWSVIHGVDDSAVAGRDDVSRRFWSACRPIKECLVRVLSQYSQARLRKQCYFSVALYLSILSFLFSVLIHRYVIFLLLFKYSRVVILNLTKIAKRSYLERRG